MPLRPADKIYELLKVFPGYGDCSSYITARLCGLFATACALSAWLTSTCGMFAPARRKSSGSSGTGCVCCAMILGIISLSVHAASVINWSTSAYGSGFWCMLSAIVIGVVSIPCLSAYALATTQAPEYNTLPPAHQFQYGRYQPGEYQYGNAPPPQGYPQAPPVYQQGGPPPPRYQPGV